MCSVARIYYIRGGILHLHNNSRQHTHYSAAAAYRIQNVVIVATSQLIVRVFVFCVILYLAKKEKTCKFRNHSLCLGLNRFLSGQRSIKLTREHQLWHIIVKRKSIQSNSCRQLHLLNNRENIKKSVTWKQVYWFQLQKTIKCFFATWTKNILKTKITLANHMYKLSCRIDLHM